MFESKLYVVSDDCDFFDLDHTQAVRIIVTIGGLPADFVPEDRYGLHLRGWDPKTETIEDEPRDGLEYALSLLVEIDGSLETSWSIFNERIAKKSEALFPQPFAAKTRNCFQQRASDLYAERHLGWGGRRS